jgi:hypothetical protein
VCDCKSPKIDLKPATKLAKKIVKISRRKQGGARSGTDLQAENSIGLFPWIILFG